MDKIYLHVLHEETLQEPHLEFPFSKPLVAKVENFLFNSYEPHLGHEIVFLPKTRISKYSPQFLHSYSYIGIFSPHKVLILAFLLYHSLPYAKKFF